MIPRGIRNNNPLNLSRGGSKPVWQGMSLAQNDRRFAQFVEMKWGYRAAFVNMNTHYWLHGRKTLRQLITAWAPSHENDTEAYIGFVAAFTALRPDELLPAPRMCPSIWKGIAEGMALMENGAGNDIFPVALDMGYELFRETPEKWFETKTA